MDIAIESAVHNSLQMNRPRRPGRGARRPARATQITTSIEIEHLDL
jgi:hypothetical protein